MIPPEIVDRVRDYPLFDLVSESMELRRQGTVWKGLCPFHSDNTPSLTVDEKKNSYKCYACGAGGSPIDWMMNYFNLEFIDAAKSLAERLNIYVEDAPTEYKPIAPKRKKIQPPRKLPDQLSDFDDGTVEQRKLLANLRSFNPLTVAEAVRRQFVGFTETQWCVRDATGVNGERRLLNGSLYNGKIKAKNFKGSWGGWPLGAMELRTGKAALLCEGSPDFIAGLECCMNGLDADPVGMLGASNVIHPSAIPFFKRKRVIIAKHKDTAGNEAVERWTAMLPQSMIQVIELPSFVESDLNDWIREERIEEVVEEIRRQVYG